MKYKKHTYGMLFLSAIITVFLTSCGTILGSTEIIDNSSSTISEENADNNIQDIKNTDEFKQYGETSLIHGEMLLPDTAINSDSAMNDFLKSDNTIALLASVAKEDLYVYGLKENDDSKDGILYRLHGLCIRQGSEIQVIDVDWGIYGDIPQIQYADYDNDGQKELAIILRSAQGTGLSLLDLHIFEKKDTGGWIDNRFADWAEQLNKLVTYEEENGILELFISAKTIEKIHLSVLEEDWGTEFKSVTFGNNVKFLFEDEKIILEVLPMAIVGDWATPQEITDTLLQLNVYYNGEFKLSEGTPVI